MENLQAEKNRPQEDMVFALDIGTRSIMGVVGYKKDEQFCIVDIEVRAHTKRAMIDGQIEDIAEVAAVANQVKQALEQRLHITLSRVCVAAAGRALKTGTASFLQKLSPKEAITRQMVYQLEMGAVSNAAEQLEQDEDGLAFYCVGHSVVRYYLDDYPYSIIEGHKGKTARVDIIATFLPSEVVESLHAAMAKIDLENDFLTLEPIAAMNAVIPPELRLLNLALVDIGAGTSDIALCENGSVSAYTMATVAGDEITEELIRRYLVDFATAEEIKLALSQEKEEITYTDIIGFEYTINKAELIEVITPAVNALSTVICDKILQTNGKPPAAVFLVGGGSKVSLLCSMVADTLGIDRRKVAVGGNNFMKRVVSGNMDAYGPEYATPLGIAITAANAGEHRGFYVEVNGKKKQVFRGTVMPLMDVLLLCGYKYTDILGKNGRGLAYTLNGVKQIVRGTYATPAVLEVNGEPAGITSQVKNGDKIQVQPAVNGCDAKLSVGELLPQQSHISLFFNGVRIDGGKFIKVNGTPADGSCAVAAHDRLELVDICTLGALQEQAGLAKSDQLLLVNGTPQPQDYLLQDGDTVIEGVAPPVAPIQQDQTETPINAAATAEKAEGLPITQPQPPLPQTTDAPLQAQQATPQADSPAQMQVTINGKLYLLPPKEGGVYHFLDMLNFVDIDPTKPQGDIILRHNGRDAAYLDIVETGDVIEVYWKKRV
ncbi:MAG: cell division FtsA domain-containing protein [Oscillospiraceae bacterium]|nr:cell division FtsA domain-containing protein [Oscillospiraceae bacterium]